MLNIKHMIRNRIKHFFLGSIMKKSQNYLPLTNREKAMIKWFLKFQVAFIAAAVSLIIPFQALNAFLSEAMSEMTNLPSEVAIAPVQAKSEEITLYEVKSETIREVTAYNVGDPNQTDASPCISANGENICLALEKGYNRCAANFVPFGTELQLISPATGWEFQCLVTDRMNSRYPNRVDIAMSLDEHDRAIAFGVQKLNVRILEKK